jgi:thiamine transporter ThiT
MDNTMNSRSKSVALVGIMGALGNVLALISISIGSIPSPVAGQVSWDLSNLAVAIVALYAGWRLGLLTGLVAGFVPGMMYGFVVGQLGILGVLGIMFGKGLTGLTIGLLGKASGIHIKKRSSFLAIPIVLVGYIPEFIFTVFFFVTMLPFFIPGAGAWAPLLVSSIAIKAWAEMIIISFFMSALIGNRGFSNFIDQYLGQG